MGRHNIPLGLLAGSGIMGFTTASGTACTGACSGCSGMGADAAGGYAQKGQVTAAGSCGAYAAYGVAMKNGPDGHNGATRTRWGAAMTVNGGLRRVLGD